MRYLWAPLLLLTACSFVNTAQASDRIVNLTFENDAFATGADRYYTSGIRASYTQMGEDIPASITAFTDLIPFVKTAPKAGLTWSIGQNLYTPEDISAANPPPNTRPYAAFLYGSTALTSADIEAGYIDETELMLGWVGPGVLGEESQSIVHDLWGIKSGQGWAHQLNNEPIVNIFSQRRWVNGAWPLGKLRLRFVPHAGGALGNAYTFVNTGGTFTLTSQKSPLQDHPLRVHPSVPGTGYFEPSPNALTWAVFTGAEGRWVARNIFLDGNTFSNSRSVQRHWWVADLHAGFALTYDAFRISYTFVYRTPEFENQRDPSLFGGITFSFRL